MCKFVDSLFAHTHEIIHASVGTVKASGVAETKLVNVDLPAASIVGFDA